MTVRLVLCVLIAGLMAEPLVDRFQPDLPHVLALIWLGVGVELVRRAWAEK